MSLITRTPESIEVHGLAGAAAVMREAAAALRRCDGSPAMRPLEEAAEGLLVESVKWLRFLCTDRTAVGFTIAADEFTSTQLALIGRVANRS